jgi:hypothetical protein
MSYFVCSRTVGKWSGHAPTPIDESNDKDRTQPASRACAAPARRQAMRWQERSGERDDAEYVGCDASVYGAVRGRDTMTRRCRSNGTEGNQTTGGTEASVVGACLPFSITTVYVETSPLVHHLPCPQST